MGGTTGARGDATKVAMAMAALGAQGLGTATGATSRVRARGSMVTVLYSLRPWGRERRESELIGEDHHQ